MVLTFTNAEEPDGMGDIPATGESRPVGTAWVASAAGPQSPRVTTPDVGWMVGQLRSTEGRVSFPGPETQLPVRVAELNTDSAGRGLCESGAWCNLIVPANPPVHLHAMFFSDDVRVGTDEARRMGERTLEVLRAANTLAYGAALPVLPVSRAERRALLWWLVPCVLLALTVRWAFIAPLGLISAAIGIARRARMSAGLNWLLAWVRHFALGIVLFPFLRRLVSERKISEGTGDLCEKADEALRSWADTHVGVASSPGATKLLEEGRKERSRIGQWAKKADDWEKTKTDDLFGSMGACRETVRTRVREAKKGRSAGKTARERMDGIRSSLRDVQKQLELARKLQREAGEGRELGKEARHLAGRADRWATKVKRGAGEAGSAATTPESPSSNAVEVRASAAEAMGTVAKVVRRDARERFEAAYALPRIAVLRYGTARAGLKCLIMWLREKRGKKRDALATSFNRLGRVLAEFCTFSWNWRVVACGVAALAAAVHGFVARVDDPIMNVALSGVSEDVWTLVYVGLGAMIFLASALQWGEYSIGKSAEKSLRYWIRRARRRGTESKWSLRYWIRRARRRGTESKWVAAVLDQTRTEKRDGIQTAGAASLCHQVGVPFAFGGHFLRPLAPSPDCNEMSGACP